MGVGRGLGPEGAVRGLELIEEIDDEGVIPDKAALSLSQEARATTLSAVAVAVARRVRSYRCGRQDDADVIVWDPALEIEDFTEILFGHEACKCHRERRRNEPTSLFAPRH